MLASDPFGVIGAKHTELELPSPHSLGGVADETLGEVALHTANHVVASGLASLANDAKGVVLHDRGAADPAQKALLHATLELEDGDLGRWLNAECQLQLGERRTHYTYNLDLDGYFSESDPGNGDARSGKRMSGHLGKVTYKTVMKTANHISCPLSRMWASDLHSPVRISKVLPRMTKAHVD